MAERSRRRPGRSATQTTLVQLEARLAHLEGRLEALHAEASAGVGATRARLEGLERRAADQIARVRATVQETVAWISRTLAASRDSVGVKAGRLTRAVPAGVKVGTRACRHRAHA